MQPAPSSSTLAGRLRAEWERAGIGRRATGIAIALLLEAGLILLLLTLSMSTDEEKPRGPVVSTFDTSASEDQADTPEAEQEPEAERQPQPQPPQPDQAAPEQPAEPVVTPLEPAPVPPPVQTPPSAIIPTPRNQVPDTAQPPKARAVIRPSAPGQTYGPPAGPRAGDSERVGTAPDGKPLYRAAWYREPTQQELRGYLSTAQSPSVGIIACRTVPDFRVEDCVLESESPQGSNIGRAVLAAAWQFQVRPPRIGGRSLYGEWVRIRITYN